MRHALALVTISAAGWAADKDLTFHATFNGATDAIQSRGDKRLYLAPSYKEQDAAKPFVPDAAIEHRATGGMANSGCLRFTRKNTRALFYRAQDNVAFDPKNWSGTITFWLNVDPETELEPGFCDPIQVTDKAYNDSAIWVDFTRDEKPRHFRLGVFGNLKDWNPQNVPNDKNPAFNTRLVVNPKPPFAKGKWTHVAIAFAALGSGKGSATLYLDGKAQGAAPPIAEPFQWDMSRAALRLGVNYVGLMDEVAVYRRPLRAREIERMAKRASLY